MQVQDPTLRGVRCDACGTALLLRVRPLTAAEDAWRWYDCPKCRKPNFLRLPAKILEVGREARDDWGDEALKYNPGRATSAAAPGRRLPAV